MNERLKELIVQCTDAELTKPWPLVDSEKLAQLIIKDCVDVIKQNQKALLGIEWDMGMGYDAGLTIASIAIRQHFADD